jgi:hypothetical protein
MLPNDDRLVFESQDIRELLQEIGLEFVRLGQTGEIAIYGGAALLLNFASRPATRDIDFVAMRGDSGAISDIADIVGQRHGLASGWFNDAVKMFVSDEPDHLHFGDFPIGGPAGLRVFIASPQYILAMKMGAMRSSLETSDMLDVWNLMDETSVVTLEECEAFFRRFYPGEEISQRNKEILLDLVEDKKLGMSYDAMRYWGH